MLHTELCNFNVIELGKKVFKVPEHSFVFLEVFYLLENVVTFFIQQLFKMGVPAKPCVCVFLETQQL